MKMDVWRCGRLAFIVFDLRRQVVPNVAVVLNFVLDDQRNVGGHRELDLRRQRRRLGERVQVSAGERQRHWLLHLNDDRLLLLVDRGGLRQFHIGRSNVAARREFNACVKLG